MGLSEMQTALSASGKLIEDWLNPQRNEDGICEALCLDWLSRKQPMLSPAVAPSERGREALIELQGLLEDTKKLVAARAEEKTAQNVAARASTIEKFRAKCEEGLKGYEGRYADLFVPCARKPHGPFPDPAPRLPRRSAGAGGCCGCS